MEEQIENKEDNSPEDYTSYHKNAFLQKTYIPGLDDHLRGGIPQGNTILIKGAESAGKTVFMCQSCANSSKLGLKSIIINLEMKEEELINEMMKFGADKDKIKENVKIITIPINKYFQGNDKEIGKISIVSIIDDALKKFDAKYIFIDSLTTITASRDLFLLPIVKQDNKSKKNVEIAFKSVKDSDSFFYWFIKSFKKYEDKNVYLLGAEATGLFKNAVDWIIALYAKHFRNDVSRWLIIEKSRLSNVSGAIKSFRIIRGIGITVHNFKIEPNKVFDKEIVTIPYGLSTLDKALSGGQIIPGLTMLIGPPGKGKTVLSLISSYKRAINGKKILFISFEQNERDLRLQAYRLKFDFAPLEKIGAIKFVYLDLSEIDDKILAKLARIIQWNRPDILVLDSLTGIENNIPMSELNEEGEVSEGNTVSEAKKRWVYAFTTKLKNLSSKFNMGILMIKSTRGGDDDKDNVFEDVDVAISLNERWKYINFTKYNLSLGIIKSRFTGVEKKYENMPCRIKKGSGVDFPNFFIIDFIKNYFKDFKRPKKKFETRVIENEGNKNMLGFEAHTSSIAKNNNLYKKNDEDFNKEFQA